MKILKWTYKFLKDAIWFAIRCLFLFVVLIFITSFIGILVFSYKDPSMINDSILWWTSITVIFLWDNLDHCEFCYKFLKVHNIVFINHKTKQESSIDYISCKDCDYKKIISFEGEESMKGTYEKFL